MLAEVSVYLGHIREYLHLDPVTERQVLDELYTHFEDKVAELQDEGVEGKDAARLAILSFGQPRAVGRLIYEAFNRGSWQQTSVAALPHLLVAALFLSHRWSNLETLLVTLLFVASVTVLGWRHGRPNWIYSWAGYSLAPLLVIGYMSHQVVEQGVNYLFGRTDVAPHLFWLATVSSFYLLSLVFVCMLAVRAVRRDWLLASVMLVPFPIFGSWLFFVEQAGGLSFSGTPVVHLWDWSMALAFVALAMASASFIRLRKRAWKVVAVVLISCTTLIAVGPSLWVDLGILPFMLFSLLLVAFLLSPALVEARVKNDYLGVGYRTAAHWAGVSSGTK